MTAMQPLHLVLASAGLAAVVAAAVYMPRADSPPDTAALAILPPACSGCDARHARLQSLRIDLMKAQE
jgi:hypothetical protein